MTMKEATAAPTFRHEHGVDAKRYWQDAQTLVRWEIFRMWATEARRLDLRAANRRFRVHNGMTLRGA